MTKHKRLRKIEKRMVAIVKLQKKCARRLKARQQEFNDFSAPIRRNQEFFDGWNC